MRSVTFLFTVSLLFSSSGIFAVAQPTAGELATLEDSVVRTATKALPAFVFIDGGSGVVISSDGSILTNNHVVADIVKNHLKGNNAKDPVKLRVSFVGGRQGLAQVIGRDPDGDIALLKMVEPGPYPHLELGDSDRVRIGQPVIAVGNPFLLGESAFAFFAGLSDFSPSVSLGVVSALHRKSEMYPDAIQTDVAVNPGNSGGPLLTTEGEIIGINGKIQTRFLMEVNSGVGYAVPSNQILRFLDPLKQAGGGVVHHGTIRGLHIRGSDGAKSLGVSVTRVDAGSPGEKAGFLPGDQIVSIEGKAVWNGRRFQGLLATYPAGSRIAVKVDREGAAQDVEAFVDPSDTTKGWLGVRGETALGSVGGVKINVVESGGPAEKAGLQVGDVIVKLDGKVLKEHNDLASASVEWRAGQELKLHILRGDREEQVAIRLDPRPGE